MNYKLRVDRLEGQLKDTQDELKEYKDTLQKYHDGIIEIMLVMQDGHHSSLYQERKISEILNRMQGELNIKIPEHKYSRAEQKMIKAKEMAIKRWESQNDDEVTIQEPDNRKVKIIIASR